MGFPTNLLDTDERVVMHLHPHWKTLAMPVFWLLVVGAAVGATLTVFDNSIVVNAVLAIGLIVLVWLTIVPLFRWMTTHFVLTSHRVMTRKGILHREGRDVPLSRINDVSFSHTIVERLLGAGTLVVESAGERGQVVLRDIPHAEEVQTRLYRLVEEDAERRASMHHTPRPAPDYPERPGPPPGQNPQQPFPDQGYQEPRGAGGYSGEQGGGYGERPAPPGAGPYSEPPR